MFELDGITIVSQKVLEKSAQSLLSLVLVDLEMIEVLTSSRIALKKVAILVLNGAFRSHTHLYDWQ